MVGLRRWNRWGVLSAIAMMAVASGARADSPGYTAVDLYTLNTPANVNFPSAGQFHPTDGGQVVGFGASGGYNQALLWSIDGTVVNLQPTNLTGYITSVAQGIGGGQVVGNAAGPITGLISSNSANHAMLWNGSAGTAVDLHPTDLAGYSTSTAVATDGVHQVGTGALMDGINHALLWSGSAASAGDLHPTHFTGYFESDAFGVSGNQQVGVMTALPTTGGSVGYPNHAVLWTGTAASAIDLNPAGFVRGSAAYGVGGGQQVGYASIVNSTHAMLWTGTAASAVDLNPTGATVTIAYATNGTSQVGYQRVQGTFGPVSNAMAWKGTAASAINLETLLPANEATSTAYSVNAAGDVFGVAGDTAGSYHAIEWIATPHAATGSIAGGINQNVTVAGRSPQAGDVHVSFASATAGAFTNTNGLSTAADLAARTGAINFALPTVDGLAQTWDLAFDGSFTGDASVIFHYDASGLAVGIDPADLRIEHFTGGEWVTVSGTVDSLADTITISTDSFSPFVLAMTPEPSTLSLFALATVGLLRRRRYRKQ